MKLQLEEENFTILKEEVELVFLFLLLIIKANITLKPSILHFDLPPIRIIVTAEDESDLWIVQEDRGKKNY